MTEYRGFVLKIPVRKLGTVPDKVVQRVVVKGLLPRHGIFSHARLPVFSTARYARSDHGASRIHNRLGAGI